MGKCINKEIIDNYLIISLVSKYERIFTMILSLSLSNILLLFDPELLGESEFTFPIDFLIAVGGCLFAFPPLPFQMSGEPLVPLSTDEFEDGVRLDPEES